MDTRFDRITRGLARGLSRCHALRRLVSRFPRGAPTAAAGSAFDALTRALAEELPRREAVRRVGAGLARGPLGCRPIRHALLALVGLWLLVAPARAEVVASPTTIGFGSVPVNACVRRTFTVSAHDPGALVISVQLTGDTAGFTLNAPPGFSPPTPIPGAGWTFTVDYAPGALGSHAATVVIQYQDSQEVPGTAMVALSATTSGTLGPLIFTQVPSYDFGPVRLGKVAVSHLEFSNQGTVPFLLRLTINSSLVGAGDFDWVFPHGTTLTVGPGQSLRIANVRFRPSALGTRTGAVRYAFDTCSGTQFFNVGFTGTGVP